MHKSNDTVSFPVLESERLLLKNITSADKQALQKVFSPDEFSNSEYMIFGPYAEEDVVEELIEWAKSLFAKGKGILWGIVEKQSNTLIGVLDYIDRNDCNGEPFRTEVGYDLIKEYWGKGLAVEAIRCTIPYIFDERHLIRIEADPDVLHYRSIRVLMKAGFQAEGILRRNGCRRGKIYDSMMFSLLKGDWIKENKTESDS